jgi:hypothetical protein
MSVFGFDAGRLEAACVIVDAASRFSPRGKDRRGSGKVAAVAEALVDAPVQPAVITPKVANIANIATTETLDVASEAPVSKAPVSEAAEPVVAKTSERVPTEASEPAETVGRGAAAESRNAESESDGGDLDNAYHGFNSCC